MPDYQKMYCILFGEITRIIEQLQTIQKKMEELYIDSEKEPISLIKKNDSALRNVRAQRRHIKI